MSQQVIFKEKPICSSLSVSINPSFLLPLTFKPPHGEMWTSICVLERRAKRNSTICSLVCSKTTARRLPAWVRPVPTGRHYSLRQPRSEGFLFTIRCGEYSIFTIFTILSQEVKPGWDPSHKLFGPKQSKNVAEPQQEVVRFTQMKAVCQRRRKMWRVSLLLYKRDRDRRPLHYNQPLNQQTGEEKGAEVM